MFRIRARSVSPPPVINVTPLIDVLLVLLIIFMVIQPQKEAKLPVKAPERAPTIEPPPSPETLMLTVSDDMRLELNSKPIEMDALFPLLTDLMQQRPLDNRALFIKAPAILTYGPVVLLIDLAKGAGVVTLGLVKSEG